MKVRLLVRRHGVTLMMILLPLACSLETLAEPPAVPDSNMTRESAESALNGRRLFFTPQQRLDAMGDLKPAAERGTDEDLPAGQPTSDEGASLSGRDSVSHHSEGSIQSAPPGTAGVYFDGFVSGPRGTRLLVNGLPCHVRVTSTSEADRRVSGVDCPAVTRSRPLLSLALVKGRLQVSRGPSVMGLLRPGQSL